MVFGFVLVPVVAAVLGWGINRAVTRAFLKRLVKKKGQIAVQLGKTVAETLSFNQIVEKISQPENVQKLMPYVEQHVDHFLRVKLVEQMPMIGMLIGEKTIAQLKAVFITELELLFPVVMGNYAQQLQGELDLEKIIAERLDSFPAEKMEAELYRAVANELRYFELAGAVAGLLIGGITALISLLVQG